MSYKNVRKNQRYMKTASGRDKNGAQYQRSWGISKKGKKWSSIKGSKTVKGKNGKVYIRRYTESSSNSIRPVYTGKKR